MAEETLELGGKIQLTGFSEIDRADMIVVKKIVGNHVKRIAEHLPQFDGLHLTLKKVHAKEGEPIYEIHGQVVGKGKVYTCEINDRNIYVGLDLNLKKLASEIGLR